MPVPILLGSTSELDQVFHVTKKLQLKVEELDKVIPLHANKTYNLKTLEELDNLKVLIPNRTFLVLGTQEQDFLNTVFIPADFHEVFETFLYVSNVKNIQTSVTKDRVFSLGVAPSLKEDLKISKTYDSILTVSPVRNTSLGG